jgi:putative DNA-invertase from lambdoid prophage Rac
MIKTYLGDSVYASFDGYGITLTTENAIRSEQHNRARAGGDRGVEPVCRSDQGRERESRRAMSRVGIYLRVSTAEQSVEAQRLELGEYCRRRGWAEIREYSDTISGAKSSRAGLDAMMADVRKRSVHVVICTKLDRLGRSLSHLAQICDELGKHNVALVCPGQGIDTTDSNPAGRLQMHVLMAVAEFERSLIRDRTKAGLAVARAKGKTLGRRRFKLTPEKATTLTVWKSRDPEMRWTIAELANALGCSVGTAHALTKA